MKSQREEELSVSQKKRSFKFNKLPVAMISQEQGMQEEYYNSNMAKQPKYTTVT